jgi:hypothetical protein
VNVIGRGRSPPTACGPSVESLIIVTYGPLATSAERIVVCIMYPPEWFGSPPRFEAELERIRAVDPRIDVVVATYVEPHELRTARGAPVDGGEDRGTHEQIEGPVITAEERDVLRRIHEVPRRGGGRT